MPIRHDPMNALPDLWARSFNLAWQFTEMNLTAWITIQARMTRLALAGPDPSPRERSMMQRMVAEKFDAAHESAGGMLGSLTTSVSRGLASAWHPATLDNPWEAWMHLGLHAADAWLHSAHAGLRPVHRRTMHNARTGGG